LSTWLEIQENLVKDRDLIAEIGVEMITLMRLGGYKATPYSLKLNLLTQPSAKSLKGIWRWWARAAIVGAYNGKINYKEANKYLNKLLGGTGKDEGISSYTLQISDVKFPVNHEQTLNLIKYDIDKFYEKAKEFLIRQEPQLRSQLRLPYDTQVSVQLNPSNTAIIIENKKMPLDRYKNTIYNATKQGPLKDYIIDIRLAKKGRRIEIKLVIQKISIYSQIPRVKLLIMKREDEEDTLDKNNIDSNKIEKYLKRVKEEMAALVSKGLSFKILLYGNMETKKVNFALSSFLLSLILGGIGSITKRGFGSLRLLSLKLRDGLQIDERIKEIFEKLQKNNLTKDELTEILKKLCNIVVICARNVLNVREQTDGIPDVPSLSNIRIEVIECPFSLAGRDVMKKSKEGEMAEDLNKIGRAFVKQTWKLNPMEQGRNLHTWILGLPRFRNGTGYAIKTDGKYDPLRRTSSIGARYFVSGDRGFIIVYGFLSNDWCKDLLHIRREGQREREKKVKEILGDKTFQMIFDEVFKKVSEMICR